MKNLKNYNVIYIEDNKFNIKLIENLGEKLGLKIKSFPNPKDGLEYILNNPVDLLLVDYMMPELNGIDLVKILKKEKPDVPIIMITALDDLQLRQKATLSGIDAFLPKPVNVNEFREAVFSLLKDEEEVQDTILKDVIDVDEDLILVLENKKIKIANKSFLRFFGYINEDEINFDFLKFFVIEDKYAWGDNIDEFIQNVLKKSDLVKINKNGEIYYFKVKVAVYKFRNRVVIIFKDITENERLKKEVESLKAKISYLEEELESIKEAGFIERLKILFLGVE